MAHSLHRPDLRVLFAAQNVTSRISDVSSEGLQSGGFADIFQGILATDGGPIKIAIKIIRSNDPELQKTMRRHIREVQAWHAIRHPCILPLLGLYWRTRSLPGMVAAWCEHGTIRAYLDTWPPGKEANNRKYELLLQVAHGLAHLHGHSPPIVHGDLKGNNILVSGDGLPKICDFGLAKITTVSAETKTGIRGTLHWMAPELLTGEDENPVTTLESDIWAYACVMIEVFSGAKPYGRKGDAAVIIAHSRQQIPSRPPDMPDACWELARKCFENIPSKRITALRILGDSRFISEAPSPVPSCITEATHAQSPVPATVAHEPSGSIFEGLDANRGVIDVDTDNLDACQQLVDMVPQLGSGGYSLRRRYDEINAQTSYVRFAVAKAAQLGSPLALKWFEQGRRFVWSQIRNVRSRFDFEDSEDAGADLTEKFNPAKRRNLVHSLDRIAMALEAASGAGDAYALRRLVMERDRVVGQIRTLDGLCLFRRPIRVNELALAGHEGAVVCINVSQDHSCHALIPRFTTSGHEEKVLILDLSAWWPTASSWLQREMDVSSAIERTQKSISARPLPYPGDIRCLLREMWMFIVKPVLDALGISTDEFPPYGVDLPRITWCTTGALAYLPLHAAGPYDAKSPGAFDLVVSSYTPNIACILPSSTLPEARTTPPTILVVANGHAPNFPPLPGVYVEADLIQDSCWNPYVFVEADATVDRVLSRLGTCDYLHFACHAEQDPDDPLKSSFVLHDGRLTLETLMSAAQSSGAHIGELAFHSACETARGNEAALNESIHIAAGMLSIGFRSVVATMWTIGDMHAEFVAVQFYKTLLGQCADEGGDVARALHRAVAMLRERIGHDQVAKWASYVHYGV